MNWLLESTVDGSTWHRRFSSYEAEHNRMDMVRNAWLKAFPDLGFTPVFVSSDEVEQGRLLNSDLRELVLLQSLALSAKEAEKVRGFIFAPAGKEPAIQG